MLAFLKPKPNQLWTHSPTNVGSSLAGGGKVSLVGFGTFSVSHRAARTGRNPQTGASIQIAAKNVAKFKAGSDLSGKL